MIATINNNMSIKAMAMLIMAAIRADETAAKRIAACLSTQDLSFITSDVEVPETVSVVNSDVFEQATGISVDGISEIRLNRLNYGDGEGYEVLIRGFASKEERDSKSWNEATVIKFPLELCPDYGLDYTTA